MRNCTKTVPTDEHTNNERNNDGDYDENDDNNQNKQVFQNIPTHYGTHSQSYIRMLNENKIIIKTNLKHQQHNDLLFFIHSIRKKHF